MGDFDDIRKALAELLGSMRSVDSNGRETLARYLELERSLVGQYRDLLTDRAADRSLDDAMQGFAKLTMSGFMETIAVHRRTRRNMMEAQAGFADNYMAFLDSVASALEKSESAARESDASGAEEVDET